MTELLYFGKGNAKLGKQIYTFSIPSGFTCPGALDCLSKANRETGKIVDGKETKFRCFSASQESLYKNVRESRWKNFELLRNTKSPKELVTLIRESLPKNAEIIRIHVAGDFYNQIYFNAWACVALLEQGRIFYFYTKSLPFWVKHINLCGDGHKAGYITNFIGTASKGGRYDELISKHNLRESIVVFSEEEADRLHLEIDHDDTHAMKHGPDFALLLHGIQPKASEASKALSKLKKIGKGGYSRRERISLTVLDK